MSNLRYTKDHEWIRIEGDVGVVGITDYAQAQLGDVVYVELPDLGRTLAPGDEAAVVESVKAASEVYSPAAGEIVEVNERLIEAPGIVNEDAEGTGWFLKLRLATPAQCEALMSADQYRAYLETLE